MKFAEIMNQGMFPFDTKFVKNKTEKPFSLQMTKRTGRTGGTGIYFKEYSKILRNNLNIQEYSKIFRNIPKYSGIFPNNQEYSKIFQHMYSKMFQNMQVHSRFQ